MRTALVIALLLLSGCSSSNSGDHPAAAPSYSTLAEVPALGAHPITGETKVYSVDATGPTHFNLPDLDSRTTKVILRWACFGSGAFQIKIDGVDRVLGGCPYVQTDASITTPLDFHTAHNVAVITSATTKWRLYIGQV